MWQGWHCKASADFLYIVYIRGLVSIRAGCSTSCTAAPDSFKLDCVEVAFIWRDPPTSRVCEPYEENQPNRNCVDAVSIVFSSGASLSVADT